MHYVYKRRLYDTQYGIRKDGDICNIFDSAVVINTDIVITVKEKEFRGSEGLWELLTRNREIKQHVTIDDLRTYNKMLLITKAQLDGYQPGVVINVNGEKKFREIIAPLFEKHKGRGVETALRSACKYIELSTSRIYYDPGRPSAFSTLSKLAAAIPKK